MFPRCAVRRRSSSVLTGNPLVALRVTGVQTRLQFPGLAAGLPVSQHLEQGDDTGPQVQRDARFDDGDGEEGDGEEGDSEQDGGQDHPSDVGDDED